MKRYIDKIFFKNIKIGSQFERKLNLNNFKDSEKFYNRRYEGDYMEDWSKEKKERLFEIFREINLPEYGDALDFGCGNGVLTEIIRKALPKWKIYGTDLSTNAIFNAKNRFPNCIFFDVSSEKYQNKKFDLVFTNHVFEHVFNIKETFNKMDKFLKNKSYMLHFLPCGNKGSYEYNLCKLRNDGINHKVGNRFFYEDEGHVRRLTSKEFVNLASLKKFKLKDSFFSNQYYGAINWLTNDIKTLYKYFINTSNAVSKEAKEKLNKERNKMVLISIARLPAAIILRKIQKYNKKISDYFLIILFLPFFLFSKVVNDYWKNKALQEWVTKKKDKRGSEMILFFER